MEVYKLWNPLENIPAPLYLEAMHDDCEGVRFLLRDGSEDGRVLRIVFDSPLGYRNVGESYRLKTWEENESFEGHSSLLIVEGSDFLEWFHDKSYNMQTDLPIVHYAIFTPDDCIDVLSTNVPKVEWLFPKS